MRRNFIQALAGAFAAADAIARQTPAATGTGPLKAAPKVWRDHEGAASAGGIGPCDGFNRVFRVSYPADPVQTNVYVNGLHLPASQYTLAGQTLALTIYTPQIGDTIEVVAVAA